MIWGSEGAKHLAANIASRGAKAVQFRLAARLPSLTGCDQVQLLSEQAEEQQAQQVSC